MALPNWITEIKGKPNTYVVDPDKFYPAILAELGVEKPDRYWLEVAFGIMKLDSDLQLRMSGKMKPGVNITRMIRADDGRKARWNLTMHPAGKQDWATMPLTERSRVIREHYRRIRGFVPSG